LPSGDLKFALAGLPQLWAIVRGGNNSDGERRT
jgi:hypothetical protein